MKESDYILTISDKVVEEEYREKGSRFLGFAHYCPNEEKAEKLLQDYKKKYYDATHVCYAFRITDNLFRYSDAGEPTGTAGIPIYNAIQHHQLYKVIVFVVRYFGGTKLGTGGLARAYYGTADKVLEKAQKMKEILYGKIYFELDYSQINTLMKLLEQAKGQTGQIDYGAEVKGFVQIPLSKVEYFVKKMTDATRGKGVIKKIA